MKRKKKPKYYWEEIFINENEFKIYQYICGNIKRREGKKIKKEFQFNRYKCWKEYIEKQYKQYSKEQLYELSRYLNYKKRMVNSTNKWLYSFAIPFIIVIVTNIFWKYMVDLEAPTFNLDYILCYLTGLSIIGKLVLCILIIIILLLLILAIPIALFILMLKFMKTIDETEQRKVFYEDYKDIVDSIIEKNVKEEIE